MTGVPGWQTALARLRPLEVIIEAALARGDDRDALRCAYYGAMQTVEVLAPEEASAAGLTAVHGIWVELTQLPLAAHSDGTLVESDAFVSLNYQRYELTDEQAVALTDGLATLLPD